MATLNPNSHPFHPWQTILYFPPPPPFNPYGVYPFPPYFPKPSVYIPTFSPQQLLPLSPPNLKLQTIPKVENPNPPPSPKRRVEKVYVDKVLVGKKEGLDVCYKRVVQSYYRPRRPRHASVPTESFEFKLEEGGFGDKTTLMIRNIPNKFPKKRLLEYLEAHCRSANSNVLHETGVDQPITLSEFDFFYLPIDFKTGNNLGYAFINFTSPVAAWRLHRDLHNKPWSHHESRKICEITYARIQGLDALRKHFEKSTFFCDSDAYLPEIFCPCRNGSNPSSVWSYSVGRRLRSRRLCFT